MKGLFAKDLLIVRRELRTLVMLAAFGVMMSLVMTPAYAVFYIAMVAAMMALGTMAYDEADNGYRFLLTLPVSRRDYVLEKYLFCGGWTLLFTVLAALACLLVALLRGSGETPGDMARMAAAALGFALLMDAVMIPARLKFGSEKSRLVLYVAAAAVTVAGLLLRRFGQGAEALGRAAERGLWLLPAAALAALVLSLRLSRGIMEKKEF